MNSKIFFYEKEDKGQIIIILNKSERKNFLDYCQYFFKSFRVNFLTKSIEK